jgi:hypothetical protein
MRRVRRALTVALVLAVVVPADASALGGEVPRGPRFCPTDGAERFDTRRLEGRTFEKARRMASRHACDVRVLKRGNTWLFYTFDDRRDRVNVALEHGRVVEVFGVY